MELVDNFNQKLWSKVEPGSQEGFVEVRIARRHNAGKGVFKYVVMQIEADDPKQVTLEGASGKNDPLNGVANAEMKISSDNKVLGVTIDDECVVYNG